MKAFIAKIEKTKWAEQTFRVVRITALGVVAAKLTGSPLDAAGITAIVEAAFRQAFPAATAAVAAAVPEPPPPVASA